MTSVATAWLSEVWSGLVGSLDLTLESRGSHRRQITVYSVTSTRDAVPSGAPRPLRMPSSWHVAGRDTQL